MIYKSGQPIYHSFNSPGGNQMIVYNLVLNSEVIYTGRVYPFDGESTVTVNLSPVIQDYMDTNYESLAPWDIYERALRTPSPNGNLNSVNQFTVVSDNNIGSGDYLVIYNYDDNYEANVTNFSSLATPISPVVDDRQLLFHSLYKLNNGSETLTISVNDSVKHTYTIGYEDGIQVLTFNLKEFLSSFEDPKKISISYGGSTTEYEIVNGCGNDYVLYYVNKQGGMDSLLFDGRNTVKYGGERTNIRVYKDRLNRYEFENKNLSTSVQKTWELNSTYIKDEYSYRIDDLIYSPKVWLHDLKEDKITAVNVETNNIDVKYYKKDGIYRYTVNVNESQKQIRK